MTIKRDWLDRPEWAMRLKPLLAVLYGVGISLLFWVYTRSSLALYLLLPLSLTLALLHLARALAGGPVRLALNLVSVVVTAAFGVSVLIGIVITPFSAYRLWFESMAEGTATGTVSNLFTLMATFFSTALGATFITMGYIWPLLLAAGFTSAIVAVIVQTPLFYLLSVVTTLACVFYLLLRGGERTHTMRRVLYGCGFFAVVMITALLLSGSRTATGSKLIDVTLHPKLRQYVSNSLPQFPLLYGIPGYGYSFQERSLGGTPVLSPLPIFQVRADVEGPLYLKTDVFDYYDGKTWKTTFKPEETIRSPDRILWRGRPLLRNEPIRVELLIDFYNKLPYTLDTERFRFADEVPAIESGHFHRGFQLTKPLVAGDVLFIERAERPGLLQRRSVEPVAPLSAGERRRYLQLPRGISREVREITDSFENPESTQRQVLSRLASYLADTCTYSLNVENLRRSEDFIDKFLFDEQKGYCVHFATTFTTMARLHDIPARYNTGFLINFPAGENETTVTGLAAHSWAEVWLEDSGWTAWEATPAVTPNQYSNFFGDDLGLLEMMGFYMELDEFTLRQVESILGDRAVDVTGLEGDAARAMNAFPAWQIGSAVAGVLMLALLAWRVIRRLREPRQRRELRPLMRVSRRYVLLARTLGVPDPRRIGWLAWRDRYRAAVARRAPAAQRLLERFTGLVAETVYAGRVLSKRDLRFVRAAYRRLLRYRLFPPRRRRAAAGAARVSGV